MNYIFLTGVNGNYMCETPFWDDNTVQILSVLHSRQKYTNTSLYPSNLSGSSTVTLQGKKKKKKLGIKKTWL